MITAHAIKPWLGQVWQLRCDICRAAFTYPAGKTADRARLSVRPFGWSQVGGQDWCPRCSAATVDPWPAARPYDPANPWGVPF